MSRNIKTGPSLFLVVFHTLMVLMTGGVWLIPLGIWWLLNNKK